MIHEPGIIETEKRILALDSQILDAIQKCAFFTYLNFMRNFRPNEEKREPLDRGHLGHTLQEVYYRLLQKKTDWNEAVELATEEGRKLYKTLPGLDLSDAEWVIKTFHQYADFYRHDEMKILGIEEPFSFVIYEDDELIVVYEGKIDLHAELPNLGPSVYDHKWRQVRADYCELDNQLIGYSIHANANLVYVNEVGLQKSYEPEKKFRRIPINIGDGVKERWLKNTIMWAKILDYNIQNDVWPQSHLKVPPGYVTQCAKCVFKRICNSENEEEMKRKIEDHFHMGQRWSAHREEAGTNGE